MKKHLFLLPILLLATTASASDFCVKKTTYAVSAQGVCEKFATTCAVPEDAKVVPKCDIVEEETSSRPEDVLERRRQRQAAAYAARRAAAKKVKSSSSRRMNYSGRLVGSGALTRNRTTRQKANTEDLADRSRTRTSTYRVGASSAYVKTLHEGRNETSANQVGRTRGTISAVDRSLREGKLSNGQKFSDETHFRERTDSTSAWKAALERRNYLIKKRTPKTYVPRTVTLRRSYRGGTTLRDIRMNAGVDDSALDE